MHSLPSPTSTIASDHTVMCKGMACSSSASSSSSIKAVQAGFMIHEEDRGHLKHDDLKGCGSIEPPLLPVRPPMGRWKDGFCDWYHNCAPSCLLGTFLNCILLGQVAQRLGYFLRFKEVAGVTLGLWALSYILYSAIPTNTKAGGISNVIYAGFFFIVLCQLRGIVRARYAIPGDQYHDCCVSFWCPCCTLTQMARHLFNYQGNCGECSMGPDAEYLVTVVTV